MRETNRDRQRVRLSERVYDETDCKYAEPQPPHQQIHRKKKKKKNTI
jgi:hypothetical protein